MALTMTCPCGKILDVAEPAHGQPAQCPSCGNVFIAGEPVCSTTAIQEGEPEAKAGARSSAPESNIADERSIAKSTWIVPKAVYGLLFVLLAIGGGIAWLGFHMLPDDRGSTARIQIRGPLSIACKSYFDKNQRWPDQLKALTVKDANGIEFLESKDALVDPWGRDYQYDAKGPKNNGVRPDIWAVAPDGEIIGNWPKQR